MNKKELARKIAKQMYKHDAFCRFLGIKIISVDPGFCKVRMKVKASMLNCHNVAHGGISYTLADTALGYASNTRGKKSLSLETSISHIVAIKDGDMISASAEEIFLSNKIGVYNISVTNQNNVKVALFKGTVYRSEHEWFGEEKK